MVDPMRSLLCAALIAAALAAAACDNNIASASDRVTDTKTGTIPVKSFGLVTFVQSKRGELDIKLKSLTPPFANPVQVALSQQASGSCLAPGAGVPMIVGNTFPVGLADPATYCIYVFDLGTMTVDEQFALDITHP